MPRNSVSATFISSKGANLEATIEVAGQRICVEDEFNGSSLREGDSVEVELFPRVSDPGTWEEMFSSNPEKQRRLICLGGWRYLSLGQIVSVNPVLCDCGIVQIEGPFHTHDEMCVGEFVGLKMVHLNAWAPQNDRCNAK